MKQVRIINTIKEVCERLGIIYHSPNHKKINEFKEDIAKLVDIYLQLKNVMDCLYDLSKKYEQFAEIKKLIEQSIDELDKVDHELKTEAYLLSQKIKK